MPTDHQISLKRCHYFSLQHVLHNSDLGALGVVDVGGEVEQVGVLAGSGVIE